VIRLTVPFPPSTNHAWGQAGHRKYLKKACHEFRKEVSEAVAEAGARIEGRIAVFAALHSPTRRKYDIDNRAKTLLDALQHAGVFDDDECVDMLWLIRKDVVKGGMCRLVIVPSENALSAYMELEAA
jgi:crossover junction endodeoxyribonuclease RusA